MGEGKSTEPPKRSAGDVVHSIVKAGISAAPIAGGPAAGLFDLVVASPLERRKTVWMQSVADGLTSLTEQMEGLTPEALSQNESFVTTLLRASQAAVRNHQQEKLKALRNAVLNAALPDAPEDDLQLMLLNFVDDLTPSHMRVLRYLGRGTTVIAADDASEALNESARHLARNPEQFPLSSDFYGWVLQDLHSRELIQITTMGEEKDMFEVRPTDLAWMFLKFVASPLQAGR